ncbi:MAG: transporter [Halobacteriota archaeon]
MSFVEAGMTAIHLIFAAAWIGSIAFVTYAVLPLARDGDLDPEPLSHIVGSVTWISRISALAMVVTGSHLMGSEGFLEVDVLLGSDHGLAIVAMIVLWLALIVLIEIASRRIQSGLSANLVREPARDGLRWFQVATLIGALLLIDGALLTSGVLA